MIWLVWTFDIWLKPLSVWHFNVALRTDYQAKSMKSTRWLVLPHRVELWTSQLPMEKSIELLKSLVFLGVAVLLYEGYASEMCAAVILLTVRHFFPRRVQSFALIEVRGYGFALVAVAQIFCLCSPRCGSCFCRR